jgi:hypothetical protein
MITVNALLTLVILRLDVVTLMSTVMMETGVPKIPAMTYTDVKMNLLAVMITVLVP